jgi:2-polyprenyl-3-methyl-5-hydroxy-6-metoxy-1,4-benzoquinol methylase
MRADGARWVRCAECELVFVSPAPDAAALADFYASYYSRFRRLTQPSRAVLEAEARQGHLDAIMQFALQSAGSVPPRIADIGCGQGARLVMLRALGARVVAGCEMDADAARWAAQHYDLSIHVGSADSLTAPEGGFDLVLLSEVIEHVLDPVALVRSCARLLRPGGWLCLSTPNEGVRHRAGSSWTQLQIEFDHLTLFNDHSIRRCLRAAGMAPVEVLPLGKPSLSSERRLEGEGRERWPSWLRRLHNGSRRVLTNLRTQPLVLDPQDGYTLLCSARREEG